MEIMDGNNTWADDDDEGPDIAVAAPQADKPVVAPCVLSVSSE